jgi:dihydrolipoamide dehydrogenase
MSDVYDAAIIGGGPGGYVAAIRGHQLGLKTVLLEKERIGGVCLNRGCIPTKTLLADVEGILWSKQAAAHGIIDREPSVSFPSMMQRKNSVVDKIVGGLEKLLGDIGVTIVEDTVTRLEPGEVVTASGERVQAENIIIATGSRPWTPPIEGIDSPGVVSTREILSLSERPQRLVIIGGGIIGQEFAAIFAALGTEVTVIEALDRILMQVDPDLTKRYASLLPGRGIKTHTSALVRHIHKTDNGLRVVFEKKSKEIAVDADLVLTATGRRPYFGGLDPEEAGVEIVDGAVSVDEHLRTGAEGIYAIGDVLGRYMLAHEASFHGEIAAENISGMERTADKACVPSCVFTIPQISWVGMTEEEAQSAGLSYRSSTFPLAASGKAVALGEPRGWIKLIEDPEANRLIGAHLMGPQVSELIGELTLAIQSGMSASDLADTIHAHPTIAEAVRESALGLLDGSIHAAARVKQHTPT